MIKKLFKKAFKKTICLVMILSLVAVSGLSLDSALAAGLPYDVVFKTTSGDKNITFNSADETISDIATNRGEPLDSGGSMSKKYFIGWSDVSDYTRNDSGKLYYGYEPVSRLIEDNVSALYPAFLSRLEVTTFKNNGFYINLGKTDADTVPGSAINTELDTTVDDHNINLYFDESKDKYEINLDSSFDLDKVLAHWLYSGNGSTIMTNTQGDQGSSRKNAKYTHVDLNVTIPDEVDVPDELNLTFVGSYFQPYMALDTATRNKFEIKEVTGSEKWNLTELVSNSSPSVTFTIKNPNKSRKITLRTIVRTNTGFGGKIIPRLSAKDIENEKMKLISNTNLTISKNKALDMLKTSKTAKITGIVDGFVKMPLFFGVDILSSSIPKIEAETPVSISYSASSVKFDKNSAAVGDTGAQDLGKSNVAYNGSLKGDSLNDGVKPAAGVEGDTIADSPAPFIVGGVTYTFKEWNTKADGTGNKFDENTPVTGPITVYAIYSNNKPSGGGGGTSPDTPPTPDPRIPGDDRVDTAINISKSEYPSADTVIVVRKDLFPDSMTATVLSKQLNAPILLTGSNKLDERVKAEIKRLGAKDVIIVGGVNSVSTGVQNELKAFDKDTVERIAGLDRYGTSVAVANRVVGISGLTHKAVIASGEVFPDALAVSPFAAKNAYPILLVKKNSVPAEVNNAFAKLSIKEIYLVGGEDTISKSTEGKLPKVLERMAGKNRYETSVQIAKAKFPQSERAYMASGEVFADALVIGPVGAKYNAPILLTPSKNASKPVADYIKSSKISKLIAVGGERYVPKKVMSVYNSNIN
ncbi:cell wall-binding repeat-containing protein [Peptostreptococcus stomatis]|uniref:cell wall-binding repeat-containing protein n=1 Tax=Peptostreptococcus stomatis TaxID=341694 RepID=UPI0024A8521C|nr:cell wall-binding repeat-containing protein [Peptostreptococcus stomatis]